MSLTTTSGPEWPETEQKDGKLLLSKSKLTKCVVCDIDIHNKESLTEKYQGLNDSENESPSFNEVLNVFCTYFNISHDNREETDENEENNVEKAPFCSNCIKIVIQLCICHEKSLSIHQEIQKILTYISSTIVRTEADKLSKLNSDNLTAQESERVDNNKYRARILQSFNPRVHLFNLRHSAKREKRQGLQKVVITNVKSEANDSQPTPSSYHDDEDKDKDNDDSNIQMDDDDVEIYSEDDQGQDDTMENDDDQDWNPIEDNLSPPPANSLRKNRKKRKGSKSTGNGKKKSSTLETIEEDDGKIKRKKVKRKKVRNVDDITECGDGKFLYCKVWPYHTVENDKFCCGTCGYTISFRKGKNIHIAGNMTYHIKVEHMLSDTWAMKRVDDKKFILHDKWTFEKTDLGYECSLCKKVYNKIMSVTNHIEKCHATGEYECQKCSRSFRSQNVLRSHSCNSNPSARRQILKVGENKYLYNGKQPWPFEEINGKFYCSTCPAVRNKAFDCGEHIAREHDRRLTFVCDECGRTFHIKSVFEAHKSSHTVRQDLKCTDCEKVYKTLIGLRAHQQNAHGAPKKSLPKTCVCDKCGRSFSTPMFLKRHIEHIHDANVICPVCGKKCQDKDALYSHHRRHVMPKKFFCDMCPAGFLQNWQLIRHKKGATHSRNFPGVQSADLNDTDQVQSLNEAEPGQNQSLNDAEQVQQSQPLSLF